MIWKYNTAFDPAASGWGIKNINQLYKVGLDSICGSLKHPIPWILRSNRGMTGRSGLYTKLDSPEEEGLSIIPERDAENSMRNEN
jgi:hypothetical protein